MYTFQHYYLTAHLFRKSGHDTYLAYRVEEPERRVLLKVFDEACLVPTATASAVRQMEARLQSLKHPHIVSLLALGLEQGQPYSVNEYHPGGSLRQYLAQRASGHVSLEEAVGVVMQVGQALVYAHAQGVLHQDIRLENILLNEQGQALLADFRMDGLLVEREPEPVSGRRVVSYRAPELVIREASAASDQYALGCLLYELLTGVVPDPAMLRQHATLTSLVASTTLPTLPRQIEGVILRTLAIKPRERYQDVETLMAELKAVIQPEPPAFPFAHLTARYQPTLLPDEPEETFPPLLPVTSFSAQPPQKERLAQKEPAFQSLEAFLTIPEWGGTSLLDRLAAVDGQDDVLVVSRGSQVDRSSEELPSTWEVHKAKINETDPLALEVHKAKIDETDPLALEVHKVKIDETDPLALEVHEAKIDEQDLLADMAFTSFSESLFAQSLDRDVPVLLEDPLLEDPLLEDLLLEDAEEGQAFPPLSEEAEDVVSVVQAQPLVGAVRNAQMATSTTMSSAPAFKRTQITFTLPPLPDWKRPVTLLFVALTLAIITALLVRSVNGGIASMVTQSSLARVAKITPAVRSIPTLVVTPTPRPTAAPTPRPTAKPRPTSVVPPTSAPVLATSASAPATSASAPVTSASAPVTNPAPRPNPKPKPKPAPTSVPDFYTQATSGTPRYASSMAQPDSAHWGVGGSGGDLCSYAGGAYQSSDNSGSTFMPCMESGITSTDFTFQVEMVVTGSSGDGAGMIFRHAGGTESRLRISTNGSYDLVGIPPHPLVSGSSAIIKTGLGQSNLVTIIARGSNIYIYVNKLLLTYVTGVSSSSGVFGLFAVDFGQPTTVLFKNVKIW